MRPKNFHYNNHVSSKHDHNKFGVELFNTILENGTGIITMVVDDGDGDVWKYTIDVDVEHMKNIVQIKEN